VRIAVDIDGVLFPWDDVARGALQFTFGTHTRASGHWHALKEAVDTREWRWLWTRAGQDMVFGADHAYGNAVAAVRELLAMGNEVHFVTHRDPRLTLHHTAAFLSRHFGDGPAWAGVHSIKSRTPKRALGPWDLMIEDKPDTVFDVVAQENTMVFAPLRPWNRAELEGADGPYLRTYTDPADIVEWVEHAKWRA